MKYVLDTNAVLYHLADRTARDLPTGEHFLSVITEMELLSFPALEADEEAQIRRLFTRATLVELTARIRETAIRIRRQHRLKLPDAVVAGTAQVLGAIVLTNDADFDKVPNLKIERVELKS